MQQSFSNWSQPQSSGEFKNSLDFWPPKLLLGATLTGLTPTSCAGDYHPVGGGPGNLSAQWMLWIYREKDESVLEESNCIWIVKKDNDWDDMYF